MCFNHLLNPCPTPTPAVTKWLRQIPSAGAPLPKAALFMPSSEHGSSSYTLAICLDVNSEPSSLLFLPHVLVSSTPSRPVCTYLPGSILHDTPALHFSCRSLISRRCWQDTKSLFFHTWHTWELRPYSPHSTKTSAPSRKWIIPHGAFLGHWSQEKLGALQSAKVTFLSWSSQHTANIKKHRCPPFRGGDVGAETTAPAAEGICPSSVFSLFSPLLALEPPHLLLLSSGSPSPLFRALTAVPVLCQD